MGRCSEPVFVTPFLPYKTLERPEMGGSSARSSNMAADDELSALGLILFAVSIAKTTWALLTASSVSYQMCPLTCVNGGF